MPIDMPIVRFQAPVQKILEIDRKQIKMLKLAEGKIK